MPAPVTLTPALAHQIVSGIHAGVFPHVAAEAFGVSRAQFDDWIRQGKADDADELHRSFACDVAQAIAQARVVAEMNTFKSDPKTWLIHGPGREADGTPGWTVSVKASATSAANRNVLQDAEVMSVLRTAVEVLAPYPEARTALAGLLIKLGIV